MWLDPSRALGALQHRATARKPQDQPRTWRVGSAQAIGEVSSGGRGSLDPRARAAPESAYLGCTFPLVFSFEEPQYVGWTPHGFADHRRGQGYSRITRTPTHPRTPSLLSPSSKRISEIVVIIHDSAPVRQTPGAVTMIQVLPFHRSCLTAGCPLVLSLTASGRLWTASPTVITHSTITSRIAFGTYPPRWRCPMQPALRLSKCPSPSLAQLGFHRASMGGDVR